MKNVMNIKIFNYNYIIGVATEYGSRTCLHF